MNFTTAVAGSFFAETRNTTTACISTSRTEIMLVNRSCSVITNRRITYRVIGVPVPVVVVTPVGTPAPPGSFTVNNLADGQFGPFNPYQLQVQNITSNTISYEILIENVPYGSIPGLNLGNHTLQMGTNADGTFDYLFTSTVPLGPFQNTLITGSGGAPDPPGTGTACGCVSFFIL